MDFETSTQAKSWMFDEESLALCKEQASAMEDVSGRSTTPRVRKFASGFATRRQQQQRQKQQQQFDASNNCNDSRVSAFRSYHSHDSHYDRSLLIPTLRHGCPPAEYPHHASVPSTALSASDQDILVHFHAHQIQRLVGPSALLPELQRSSSVLSTAITLFRRFYLSNSAIDFHPRNVAAASALLAVKVDCEPKLEVSFVDLFKGFPSLRSFLGTCLCVVSRAGQKKMDPTITNECVLDMLDIRTCMFVEIFVVASRMNMLSSDVASLNLSHNTIITMIRLAVIGMTSV